MRVRILYYSIFFRKNLPNPPNFAAHRRTIYNLLTFWQNAAARAVAAAGRCNGNGEKKPPSFVKNAQIVIDILSASML
jgi:hypothetical protein